MTIVRVHQAAAKAAVARQNLEREIRKAHKDGAPLRQIAAAAKVSHETVRRILRSEE